MRAEQRREEEDAWEQHQHRDHREEQDAWEQHPVAYLTGAFQDVEAPYLVVVVPLKIEAVSSSSSVLPFPV